MAKLTKLINYAYLREECDVPQDIPDDEFEHKILRAQDTLKMLMGSAFYADYLAKFEAETIATDYPQLAPYVKQYLAWQAYEYWIGRANFKFSRAGVRIHVEEHSTAISDIQMAGLIKEGKQEAQKYKVFLVDYLNDRYESYPLYERSCNNEKVGNSFHISAVRAHKKGCKCHKCHAC